MEVQWWIDTAGKLGSATVALALLATTIAQNRWNNAVARRSAGIEDQKARLALLERRLQVMSEFDLFREEWYLSESFEKHDLSTFKRSLEIAELVFPAAVKEIQACHQSIHAYLMACHGVTRARMRADKQAEAEAGRIVIEKQRHFFLTLGQTREMLFVTARVDDVEPLPLPLLVRIRRTVRRRREKSL